MNKLLCISFLGSSTNSIGLASQINTNHNILFHFIRKKPFCFFKDIKKSIVLASKADVVIVNYVTLFLILIIFLKLTRAKLIFIPHEGEPLFPKSVKVKHSILRKLLSLRVLTKFCILLADDTYFLSGLQATLLGGNSYNICRLGVEKSHLYSASTKSHVIFFPNRKNEKIKGFNLLDVSKKFIANNNEHDLSYDDMCAFYKNAKFVIIPSLIETYSFCMIEAMLANCIIVTSKSVGLAYDLINEYGFEELAANGIHVLETPYDIDSYTVKLFNSSNSYSNSFNFAIKLGLDGVAFSSFLSKIAARY